MQALGKPETAADVYREIIAGGEEIANAWFGLVDLKTVRLTAVELASLRTFATNPSLGERERAAASFALGRALDERGEPVEAFASFELANEIMRRREQWNCDAFTALVERTAKAFAQPFRSSQSKQGNEVIFIVGLPRSGSTLVEQVLAAHPEVEGASELPYLNAVIAGESRRRGAAFPAWVAAATETDWQRLGGEYLTRTQRWRQARPRFTDKLPENWLYAGAVLAMLPDARIIDCRRNPLETCWSCYMQLFAPGRVGFSYHFDSLARYWTDYVRLCDFWRKQYPANFRLQSYEKLVAEPSSEIHGLLDFCDLPFVEACLRPHEVTRTIRTASAAQVRQPIRAGTARAMRYGPLLDPLKERLAAQVVRQL
ncbi:MAG: sulfotransferase [Dokdonella sp.]